MIIILAVSLFLCSPSWAEIYKWTDEKGTIHFTTDSATVPEQFKENVEEKKTEENVYKGNTEEKRSEGNTLRPQEKIDKTRDEYEICRQAARLRERLETARRQYSSFSTRGDVSPNRLQYLSNTVTSAEEQLQKFEEQARKNGIPTDCFNVTKSRGVP